MFVSHSSRDKPFADAVVAALERHGVRCWVAPRDILPGESWANSILKAIESSRLMVLIFSGNANASPHIRREVERAVHRQIPVAPIRVQDKMPENDLEYFLSGSHWMDAISPPFGQHLDKLAQQVRLLLKMGQEEITPLISTPPSPIPQDRFAQRQTFGSRNIPRQKSRLPLVVATALVILAVAAAVTFPQWQGRARQLFGYAGNQPPVVKIVDPEANKPKASQEPVIAAPASQPAPVIASPVGVQPPPYVVLSTATKPERLTVVRNLYLDGKLTVDQVHLADQLLDTPPTDLSEYDTDRLAEINNVLEGRLTPDKLDRAIAAIETPQQKQDRLAKEQAARDREARQAKIDSLLATARDNQNKGDGKTSLAAINDLLSLDPDNTDASTLKTKIQDRLAREQTARDQAARQAKIEGLLATAHANDDKDHASAALAALDELLSLDPQNTEAPALRLKIKSYFGPSKIGETYTNSIGMKFAFIPAGDFMMGSPGGETGRDDGEVQHKVTLKKKFMLQTTTVTQAQWKAVMGNNPSHFQGDDLPVETVSWNEAVDFCDKLSQKEGKHYRLPTEAEWEYACRAGSTTAYNTGDGEQALADAGWYDGNSGQTTHPVGQKKPNTWGLYDMHGNVWQWCNDWYANYPDGDATDPQGSANGTARVVRGGSWHNFPRFCRCAYRFVGSDTRDDFFGFRAVLDFGNL